MILQFPAQIEDGQPARVETGVVQFGDDWPGIFLRGDHALAFAMELRQLRDEVIVRAIGYGIDISPLTVVNINRLIKTLERCNLHPPTEDDNNGQTPGKSE